MWKSHEAQWWHTEDDVVVCDLCPRDCKLAKDGAVGYCGLRFREASELRTVGYGGATAIHLDPIEKKPLYHFLPGTTTLSLGMSGCNLRCLHCQNWQLSMDRKLHAQPISLSPQAIVDRALDLGARSVAFTYNEPLISAEFWMEVADACHEAGLNTVAVSNGYANPKTALDFYGAMDAANIDLKSFRESFYLNTCKAHLQPVLDTMIAIQKLGSCHLELTTLLIPGKNDSEDEFGELSQWVLQNLGAETPIHFSAFHPDYRMLDTPATPTRIVSRACDIAKENGLKHVYGGNVSDWELSTTYCAACGKALIRRLGYEITDRRIASDGICPFCGKRTNGKMS